MIIKIKNKNNRVLFEDLEFTPNEYFSDSAKTWFSFSIFSVFIIISIFIIYYF
jgi:hypothetical protein